MLGVLTAQSADEPAPLAPGDRHRIHCNLPLVRELAPEELPTLPSRPTPPVAAVAELARVASELLETVAMVRDQFAEPRLERVLDRAFDRREVSVLDELLELPKPGRRQFRRPALRRGRVPQEGADRLGSVRQLALASETLEVGLLLGAETHPEEAAGRRVVRFWHFV